MQLKQVPGRVWGSTGLLVLGRLWRSACTLVTLYLLVHHLAPADFGRFTFYLAIFMLLDSLADMGTAHATVQWTAEHPERVPGVLRVARRLRLATATLGILIVGVGAFAIGEQGAWWILLASCYPLTHALELSNLVFRNRIAWSRPVLIRAVAAGLSLATTILLITLEVRSPAAYLLGHASGSIVGNLLQHLVARRHLPSAPGPAIDWRPFLRSALPMGVAGLCQQAYFYVDNLFIRALIDDTALGHYNIAVRVMSYAIMVAVFAPLAALPWLTREHAAGRLGMAVSNLAQPLFALAGIGTGLL
ncbi:MAG: O-antigen/teichoic acid export membrane protein, partial [Chlamydiales bacterium]